MRDSTDINGIGSAVDAHLRQHAGHGLKYYLLLWSLFFLICFGLGYPTLNRYDPRQTEGLTDTIIYHQMVAGAQQSQRPRADVFSGRILIPYVAKPFYYLAQSTLKTWEPASFGLLVANSIFCATAALFLVGAGLSLTKDLSVALLGATLYLLNFAVPNLQMAGLVDSGEACFMLVVTWSLLTGRWWLLPLCGVGGALAKETFMPFSALFALVWWATAERHSQSRFRRLSYVIAMIISSSMTIMVVHLALHGHLVLPWNIAAAMYAPPNRLMSLLRCLTDRGFWYVFIWLLPLGAWHWKRLPRPWRLSSLLTALLALAFGAYNGMAGTVARPIFNIAGPMLCLSVAMLLTNSARLDMLKEERAVPPST
ncbi:MAG: hypothetical protein WCB68_05035 [Pyrinomonadaceae bacterium]